MKYKNLIFALFVLILVTNCNEESLEPTLAQNLSVETSINTAEDLNAILLGAYNRMTFTNTYGRNIIIYGEVRSDNAFSNGASGRFVETSEMRLIETSGDALGTWNDLYALIASANIVINSEVAGDADEINHLKGQALVMRALAHFDLVKIYGQQHVNGGGLGSLGVPYILEFKGENLIPARNTVGEVKDFVIADLTSSLDLMSESLNDGSKQFVTTHAANALLARVHLYFGEYPQARDAALRVINSGAFSILSEGAFVGSWVLDSTPNSIFELAYNANDNNGINGLANIFRGATYGDVQVLPNVVDLFEPGDVRGSAPMLNVDGGGLLRNFGKFPTMGTFDDNVNLIRYEEVILTYAEALLETGSPDALTWLNQIPSARGASAYTAATKENILLERRKELLFEGFRFDDLARNGLDIPNLNAFEAGPEYGSFNYAFPIPFAETNANSNMVQNSGYAN